MNILLLSQLFSSTHGGGEYVFKLIAKKLAENNHRVFVITNKIKDEKYFDLKNIKIVFVPPIIEYKGGIPPKALENLRYSINAIIRGYEIIKKEKIDLIHSNNFAPSLAGSVLSGLTGKPHIITIHDVLSLCGKNYWKIWGAQHGVSRSNLYIASILDKLIIKLKHNCIHTVSETTKEDLIKFGAKKTIHVIHNSVDLSADKEIEPNPFQFVYVGRLLFSKNLEVVIRAIGITRIKEPKIKLVIVGDGPHRKILEKITHSLGFESNIEFMGHLSEDEKIKAIQSSCALVFPSVCEGFGIVILESFACKRPVLVSDVKPMSDIITNEDAGFVIDPYDATAWAERFVNIINNISLSRTMGENGHKLLETKFTQDSMYKKIMEMYKCVVQLQF